MSASFGESHFLYSVEPMMSHRDPFWIYFDKLLLTDKGTVSILATSCWLCMNIESPQIKMYCTQINYFTHCTTRGQQNHLSSWAFKGALCNIFNRPVYKQRDRILDARNTLYKCFGSTTKNKITVCNNLFWVMTTTNEIVFNLKTILSSRN